MHLAARRRLTALAGLSLTLAVCAAWFVLFRPVPLGGPAGYIIVTGHSMEPTFYTGDLAITQRQASYAIGDVVAFETEGGVAIHRIVGGDVLGGYRVKGDNNQLPDAWSPTPSSIIGRAWIWLPQVGSVLAFVGQPASLAGLAAAIAFFLVFTAGPVRIAGHRRPSGRALAGSHAPQGREPGP